MSDLFRAPAAAYLRVRRMRAGNLNTPGLPRLFAIEQRSFRPGLIDVRGAARNLQATTESIRQ
ncbi:hypothetical protein [Burkholderia sp. PU8-34]